MRDYLIAQLAASRNVGNVGEEERSQPELMEIRFGGTMNTSLEFTVLMPGFVETTAFNTCILLGEGLVSYCYQL